MNLYNQYISNKAEILKKIPFSWKCPYCGKSSIVTRNNFEEELTGIGLTLNGNSALVLYITFIRCNNEECNKIEIKVSSHYLKPENSGDFYIDPNPLKEWTLQPNISYKNYPSYIPEAIRKDYEEACLISELSPKASATLARRCLQGIIRDYWEITKNTLNDEIKELQGKIDTDLWNAINSLRSIGNIGAHPEKDINTIVDIEDGEAKELLELIELILEEWYIAREERQNKIKNIQQIAVNKQAIKSGGNTSTP